MAGVLWPRSGRQLCAPVRRVSATLPLSFLETGAVLCPSPDPTSRCGPCWATSTRSSAGSDEAELQAYFAAIRAAWSGVLWAVNAGGRGVGCGAIRRKQIDRRRGFTWRILNLGLSGRAGQNPRPGELRQHKMRWPPPNTLTGRWSRVWTRAGTFPKRCRKSSVNQALDGSVQSSRANRDPLSYRRRRI